jgi:sarcosine oxidase
MQHFDIVVCGLGVMGSAALQAAASRGLRVVGIERFVPGHARGSSHGATRIIRLAYWEHPSYVPLVRRAFELWRALEAAAERQLLHLTGVAEIGPPDGVLVRGTLASAQQHGLQHEVLAASDVMRRFPAFQLPSTYVGVVQAEGGFLEAEPAIHALLTLAQAAGAELRTGEIVCAVESRADGVRVITDRAVIEAGAAIVTAGAWTKSLLRTLAAPLRATRQVMAWFAPREPSLFAPERFPVFLIESRHGLHYGFPCFGPGIKVALHHHRNETIDPDENKRAVSADDEALIRTVLADFLPSANGGRVDAQTCLYTMTPDGDFLIDRVPGAENVVVASPCSGHGFKFAPVIGEILADLAIEGATRHDIARFSLARFG